MIKQLQLTKRIKGNKEGMRGKFLKNEKENKFSLAFSPKSKNQIREREKLLLSILYHSLGSKQSPSVVLDYQTPRTLSQKSCLLVINVLTCLCTKYKPNVTEKKDTKLY